MEIESRDRDIELIFQNEVPPSYRNEKPQHFYLPYLICYSTIIVELKTVKKLTDEHHA